jgi:hypothetical protein
LLARAIEPDGTSGPFTVPSKRVLVVTGFQAAQNGVAGGIAGHSFGIGLLLGGQNLAFQTTVADASGTFTVQATFPTGVVVKPGVDLCIIAQDITNGFATVSIGFGAQVYGFLAKDK